MKGIKNSFSNKKFKMGGFQTLVMVIVIVLVIVINLVVTKMDILVDLSSDQIYSLTDDTKNLVDNLKDDIKIYYMCQNGKETEQIKRVLDQYKKHSKISVEQKDPVIYPNFSKDYTEETINDNDLIVVNEKSEKCQYISGSKLITADNEYAQMMGQQVNYSLDVEGQVTSAIQSITSDSANKVYYTTGHKELELNKEILSLLSKSNYQDSKLDLSKNKKIPDDCSILIINGPKYDISASEYEIIKSYLDNGGKGLFFLNVQANDYTNYEKLLSYYGIQRVKGYIFDKDNCLENAGRKMPTVISPKFEDHEIAKGLDDGSVFMQNAIGFTTKAKVRSTLKTESIMKTGDNAFSRTTNKSNSTDKLADDISGPFSVAICAEDTYVTKNKGNDYSTRLVVFGSDAVTDGTLIKDNQFGNRTMIIQTLSWLSGAKTKTLAIPTRSLSETKVNISEGNGWVAWMIILVIVVPIILLATGAFIWYKRRKR